MSDKMIDPQAAVDFMITKAGEYAKAKSDRIDRKSTRLNSSHT